MALPTAISVVLADDDDRFRGLVRSVLEDDGYRVVAEAAEAGEVGPAIDATRPDVLVLDLVMGGADGIETLRALRSRHPRLPVLVVSSLFDPLVEQQVVELGARYLEKVEGIEALEQAIDAVVAVDRPA